MKRVLVAIVWMVLMLSAVSGVDEVLIQDTTSEFTDIETDSLSVNYALDVGGDLNVTGTAYIGDMTFDGDIALTNENKLYLSTDKTKYIYYDSETYWTDGFVFVSDYTDVAGRKWSNIDSLDALAFYAYADTIGEPYISLSINNLDGQPEARISSNYNDTSRIVMNSKDYIELCPSYDNDDCIRFNTASNVPYISTVGNSNLKLSPSSGLVEVDGDVALSDDGKVYLSSDKSLYIQVNSTLDNGFLFEQVGDKNQLVSPDNFYIYSNTGGDGNGDWSPAIEMFATSLSLQATGTGQYIILDADSHIDANANLNVNGDLNVTGTAYIGTMTFDGDIILDGNIASNDNINIYSDYDDAWDPGLEMGLDSGQPKIFLFATMNNSAIIEIDSGGYIQFDMDSQSDDYPAARTSGIIMKSSFGVPTLTTYGTSELIIDSDTNKVKVDADLNVTGTAYIGDMTFNGDISLLDDATIYMDTAKNIFFRYNSTIEGFQFDKNTGGDDHAYLVSDEGIAIISDFEDTGGVGIEAGINPGKLDLYSVEDETYYIHLESGGVINFQMGSDSDDYIIFNTTNNIPYIATMGNSNLKLSPSSGLVEVDGDLNVTGTSYLGDMTFDGDISLTDDSQLYMSTDKSKYLKYNNTYGCFEFEDTGSSQSCIATKDSFTIYAYAGGDGGGVWDPAIDFSENLLRISNFASAGNPGPRYITLISGNKIEFQTASDLDDYIIINTTNNQPYISTVGNSNLKLTSSSGLVEVDGDLKVNNNIGLQDDGVLYLSADKTKRLQYNTSIGGFLLEDTSSNPYLVTTGGFSIYTNTGADGGGSWTPGLELGETPGVAGIYSNDDNDDYIYLESGNFIRLDTSFTGNYLLVNSTANDVYLMTTGTSDLRLDSDTNKVIVDADLNVTGTTILGSPSAIQNITMFSNPSGNPFCCGVMDDSSFGCTSGACA